MYWFCSGTLILFKACATRFGILEQTSHERCSFMIGALQCVIYGSSLKFHEMSCTVICSQHEEMHIQ